MILPCPADAATLTRDAEDAPGDAPAADGPDSSLARLAFLHIPKTAGTSLTEVLARRWGRVRIVAECAELYAPSAAEAFRGLNLVAGPFYAFQLDLPALRGFAPVTVLRDPLDRLVSSWRFARSCAEAAHR